MAAPLTPEDLYRFRWIDHVRLNRDGERVAYQVSWADAAARQNRSRIVVRRVLDPEPVDATGGVQRDHSPEWSPDGRKLAFVSKVGAADQLFVLDVSTPGPPLQLTTLAEGVAAPAWSPDGSRIAFLGNVASDPDAVVDDPRPPEGREQIRRAPVARVVRRLDYKFDGRGYIDGRYRHLFVVPADGGDAKQLTNGAWDVNDFDWAPDSRRLVLSGNAEPGADLQFELNLYIVDLDGRRHLFGGGFVLSSPIWSPKGDEVAFVAPNGLDAGLTERLWVVSLSGGGPRCLTADFDQAIGDNMVNDMRAGHATRICWSEQGDRIYFLSSATGATGVHSVDLDGNVRDEVGGQRRVFDFDVAGDVLAFCVSDNTNPGELHVLTNGAEAKLTDLNPWLRDRYIAQPEQHYFTAPDGWKLEGWVLKPEAFDETKLYPLVLEIHGGPHAMYGWAFFHELQILAGMGFVVFYMNPRGSDGYGERFRREVVCDWAGKDYLDLMTSLDQIIERTGYIDSKRMGVGGGSYGGYMTNWIIGQTDRFAAAVAMRSISNLVSEYSQHDIVLWGALELGPPPWPDLDELWRRSPIRYVQNVKTPLLLTAGEMDLRCAMSQSEEMFGALRLLNKTVELVRFPEETHDLSRNGRPDRRVERLRRIAGWFERFLGTAASDRAVEEETQLLPVPAEAPREWAKTIAIATRPPEAAAVEAPSAESQPEVIQPVVREDATAEAPILEPEALPDLPVPVAEGVAAEAGTSTAAADEPPLVAEAAPVEEPAAELEAEEPAPAEAAVEQVAPSEPEAEAESEAAPAEPEPAPSEPEPIAATAAAETEPPAAVEKEPEWASEIEAPAVAESTAEAEPEAAFEPPPAAEPPSGEAAEGEPPVPAAAGEEAAREAEPAAEAPASAFEADAPPFPAPPPPPMPAPEQPEPEPEARPEPAVRAAEPNVNSTLVAWPTASPPSVSENGAPAESASLEEATSVIPAWQQTDPNADSKRTVSLQAMPPEEVASGAGYAALLTFETGPFAGRIVALPDQMVTIGRAPDNDVVVGDPATSGHHGRIEVRAGSFWISDLGSTNGTLVNGEPVIEKQLTDGDMIAIGQNTLRFTQEA